MPKNRKVVKTPKGITKLNEPRKFRIGTRSGGTSAHVMSSKALRDIVKNVDRKRDHNNAAAVLKLRD